MSPEDQISLEAPPGFEPGMEVLQSGYDAFRRSLRHNHLPRSLEKRRPFALREIRRARAIVWRQGQKRDSESQSV
jgi:hypothetical protein